MSEHKVDDGCFYSETWLVSRLDGHVRREQLLATSCEPPEVTVLASGDLGVTRRWRPDAADVPALPDEHLAFALDPPRLHQVRVGGALWDFDAFAGDVTDHPKRTGFDPNPRARQLIPVVHILDDGGFAAGGWKTTALGRCSVRLGDPGRGATMRVVLAEGVLYAEVADDTFVDTGPVPDRLVLHGNFTESMTDGRWTETGSIHGRWVGRDRKARQVGVAEAGPGLRRFALDGILPDPPNTWELSYEDSSDGKTLRSTAAARPSDTFGQPVLLVSPQATCAPRNGVLEPVAPTSRAIDVPLAP